jgi:hypothetical protein
MCKKSRFLENCVVFNVLHLWNEQQGESERKGRKKTCSSALTSHHGFEDENEKSGNFYCTFVQFNIHYY